MVDRAKILVVEDDLSIRHSIEDLLEMQGFHVLSARDGFEALEVMRAERPDLVLSDIIMPRMNGYQFCQRVREHCDWAMIPFIFISVKGNACDVRYGLELGVDDYIVKPFEPDDLLAAVMGKLACI